MRRGQLADRGKRSGTVLRQRAAERLRRRERVRAGDPVGVEAREVVLRFAQREAQGIDDQPALLARVASTRRRPPSAR
jgi:hypothetical protein